VGERGGKKGGGKKKKRKKGGREKERENCETTIWPFGNRSARIRLRKRKKRREEIQHKAIALENFKLILLLRGGHGVDKEEKKKKEKDKEWVSRHQRSGLAVPNPSFCHCFTMTTGREKKEGRKREGGRKKDLFLLRGSGRHWGRKEGKGNEEDPSEPSFFFLSQHLVNRLPEGKREGREAVPPPPPNFEPVAGHRFSFTTTRSLPREGIKKEEERKGEEEEEVACGHAPDLRSSALPLTDVSFQIKEGKKGRKRKRSGGGSFGPRPSRG